MEVNMGEVDLMGRVKIDKKDIKTDSWGLKSRKKFVRSVEYEVLSNLIMQNYLVDGKPDFDRLLSIPEDSRIPGLMKEFGIRRVYQMIVLILKEFCYGTGLPKSKVLTETRMKVCACDILLFA
ncbi:MAG: hypothetical protein ACJ748_13445, partial [Flavisolibacter sp.]